MNIDTFLSAVSLCIEWLTVLGVILTLVLSFYKKDQVNYINVVMYLILAAALIRQLVSGVQPPVFREFFWWGILGLYACGKEWLKHFGNYDKVNASVNKFFDRLSNIKDSIKKYI